MNLFIKLFLFLSISTVVDGCASPDNFLLTFDKDLRVFGLRKRGGATSPVRNHQKLEKIEEVKSVDCVTDFDRAEDRIFNIVENVEKTVLNAASSLIHDEVDVLFGGDHGASLHHPQPFAMRRRKPIDTEKGKKKVEIVSMKSRKGKKESRIEQDLFGGDHGASLHHPKPFAMRKRKPIDTEKGKKKVEIVSMKSRKCKKESRIEQEQDQGNDFSNVHREIADFMFE